MGSLPELLHGDVNGSGIEDLCHDCPRSTQKWAGTLDERVLAIVAGILVARHLKTADDLFGGLQGSPRTDALIAAAVQWAERIMRKIDAVHS